jgi:hypothetical protein
MLAVSDHPPPIVDGIAVSASLLIHALLLGLALPLGLWALARGRRRAGWWPVGLGLAGFILMGAALLSAPLGERWLTVAGVSLVAIAHWRNWRAGHRGADCQTSDASSSL